MKKRLLLGLLAAVAIAVVGSIAVLRTTWAGTRLCALAGQVAERATGQAFAAGSCRVDPLRLTLDVSAVRLGPPASPAFSAESVHVRLSPFQALGARPHLAELTVRRPRVRLELRESARRRGRSACPPEALRKVEVHNVRIEEGSVDVRLASGAHVTVARLDVAASPPSGARGWRRLGSAPRSRFDVALQGVEVEAGGRRVVAEAVRGAGEIAHDLSTLDLEGALVEGSGISLQANGRVEDLCRPSLDLEVVARGALRDAFALAGRAASEVEGTAELRLEVEGRPGSPKVAGDLRLAGARIGRWHPGDATARLALRGRELRVEALELPGRTGRVRARAVVRLDPHPSLEAEAELEDVELAEVLDRASVHGSWVTLRTSGRAKVAGALSPLALSGDASLQLAAFRVLTHSWETFRPGEIPVVEFPSGRIDTAVHVSRESVRLQGAEITVGAESLRADAELFLARERGFTVRAEGGADLDELRHVSTVPIGGRATLTANVRSARYDNPRIDAEVRARGFRFLQLDLADLDAALEYGPQDHVLHARRIDGRKGETRYGGTADVDVRRSPPQVLAAKLDAHGRMRDLFDAVIPWLPSTRVVRDALDGAVTVEATAHGPATALDAAFSARAASGTLLGRPFDAGSAEGRVEAGARAVFRRAELRRGSGVAHAAGSWDFPRPHAWDLDLTWSAVALGELFAAPDVWSGAASGSARITGSLEQPDVRLAATGEGAAVAGVPLRDTRVDATLEGEALAIEGAAQGFRLAGTARAAGEGPFEALIELDHDDVGRLLRPEGPRGARLRARGAARLQGSLAEVTAARGEIRLDRLDAAYADFRVANQGPVAMTLAGRRLEVQPFRVRGTNTELTVAGSVEPGGALALDATGSLDLRVLGDSVPRVTNPHGTILLEARIGGTVSTPLLVGSGRLRSAGFQFKDVPIALSGLGGELAFSQNRVLFDRLVAAVNGGRATLEGEVELVKLFPERLRITATVDEVPLRIPEWLPTVVSGPVTVTGGWDAMILGGRLHVVRARYTEPVDLERSILEFRRRAALAKPYDPAGEWLRFDVALVVDGDARVENDLVRGTARGEVTLTGTLGAPGVVGSLAFADGSRAMFRGNEFALSHAVVDFTDRRGMRMHLDVHGETQVREYQVFMHLFGPWDAPVLQLTSQPALTQQDIVALLSLGFTTRDAALGGAAGGAATAAAAQALFSVSGLDAQVKRFLPRGGPLRDFSVRMTSAYSEGTGQVEPRAEFESKLVDERLRLRWQAPLSGARGQRAQAELRVGGRASVQYQWENDNADVATGGDHGVDLKLRWEWTD